MAIRPLLRHAAVWRIEPSAKEIPTLTRIRIASLPRKCLARSRLLVLGPYKTAETRQCHTQSTQGPPRSCTHRYLPLRHALQSRGHQSTVRRAHSHSLLLRHDTLKKALETCLQDNTKTIQSPAKSISKSHSKGTHLTSAGTECGVPVTYNHGTSSYISTHTSSFILLISSSSTTTISSNNLLVPSSSPLAPPSSFHVPSKRQGEVSPACVHAYA